MNCNNEFRCTVLRFLLVDGGTRQKTRVWALLGIYIALVLMAVSFLYHGRLGYGSAADADSITNMTWLHFEKHCAPMESNMLKRQMECSELKGNCSGSGHTVVADWSKRKMDQHALIGPSYSDTATTL